MKKLKYYLKERYNPQLTGLSYTPLGQITKKRAKEIEDGTRYGSNQCLPFDTLEEYEAEIARLKAKGERFV